MLDFASFNSQVDKETGFRTVGLAELALIMPAAGVRCALFLAAINETMYEFGIHTKARQTSFLAQIAHESGQLRYTQEIASGVRYEGRKDLGNTQPGDGVKFKGRGLIQITGRANYTACMLALDIDCIEHPELLESPREAARSAGWFWQSHGLNQLADLGDQTKVTRRINGGTNGLPDRLAFFQTASRIIPTHG